MTGLDPREPQPPPALELRLPVAADAEPLLEAIRESMAHLERWMDWCHGGYSLADAMSWIAAQEQARASGSGFEFVIAGAGGTPLGVCGINAVNRGYRMCNLGYWVRSSQTGRGVATAAVRRLAAWTWEHTDLERVEIVAAVGNAASQRVAERAGAQPEDVLRSRLLIHGVFHDAVMYSLIRADQDAGRRPREVSP